MNPSIDIVLPCFNPGNKWQDALIMFHDVAKDKYRLRFILVNDGSHNVVSILQQVDFIKENGILIDYIGYDKNMGKGYALRYGVMASKSKYTLYTDIDFPFTNESMLSVIRFLIDETCDVALGYRAENYYKDTMSFYRKVLSRTFRWFIKNILKMSITDTQCGLKGFNEKGKKKFLATSINRYLFDFEFIYTTGKDKSVNMKPVEVKLKDGIAFSKMRIKILIQEIFNLLRVLLFQKN